MSEEHGFEAPEGHGLCANNCGFFGSAAMMNLCSKCYRDLRIKEDQDSFAKAALDNKSSPSSSSSSSKSIASSYHLLRPRESGAEAAANQQTANAKANRCVLCRKRVGLTGFRCRCGSVFCGSHRYPEEHGCGFDYNKVGKEEIAKANPVVKARKLDKV